MPLNWQDRTMEEDFLSMVCVDGGGLVTVRSWFALALAHHSRATRLYFHRSCAQPLPSSTPASHLMHLSMTSVTNWQEWRCVSSLCVQVSTRRYILDSTVVKVCRVGDNATIVRVHKSIFWRRTARVSTGSKWRERTHRKGRTLFSPSTFLSWTKGLSCLLIACSECSKYYIFKVIGTCLISKGCIWPCFSSGTSVFCVVRPLAMYCQCLSQQFV